MMHVDAISFAPNLAYRFWISQLSRDARERVQLFPFRGEQQKKYNVNELTIDRLEFDRFPKTSQDAKGLL